MYLCHAAVCTAMTRLAKSSVLLASSARTKTARWILMNIFALAGQNAAMRVHGAYHKGKQALAFILKSPKLGGGGAMFKCDMCKDLLAQGQKPACQTSCPQNALIFDNKSTILAQVQKARENGKFIYGDTQNGGTSTFYISSVDFKDINSALSQKYGINESEFNGKTQKMGRPHLNLDVPNFISDDSTLIKSVLLAPVAGLVAGAIAVAKSAKKDENLATKDKK